MTANSMSYSEQMINNEVIAAKAKSLYSEKIHAGKIKRLLARLLHRSRRLLSLDEFVRQEDSFESSSYAGMQTVDIEQIRGSESRAEDFDAEFNPVQETTRDRWLGIARAFLVGKELPPVDLIQVGDVYFVRDGHHRVSVARSLGQRYIEAEITLMRITRYPM